jgi:hypothetical protein
MSSPEAVVCQIRHGLFCGLQNSLLRRAVFDRLRFDADSRNEAEDQVFAIRALSAGFRMAYIDEVLVRYYVHAANSSGSSKRLDVRRREALFEELVAGYARLREELVLTSTARRALRKRLGRELFWNLGYSTLWAAGERRAALRAYRAALREWPWDFWQLKTMASAVVKTGVLIAFEGQKAKLS